jgi:hypothetical protein
MYKNLKKDGVGDFVNSFYWSSSEGDSMDLAWVHHFGSAYQGYNMKNNYNRVRAVRAF